MVVRSTSGRVKRRNAVKIEDKIFPVTHRGGVMLVARQSHCKRRKQQELLRSRVALLGRSGPFSLTRREERLRTAGLTHCCVSPGLGSHPASFGSSSLAFLAADWALPRGKACPACRAERAAGPGAPSEEGTWIPQSPPSPAGGLGAAPLLVRAPVPALREGYKLHNRVAGRLRRGRRAEVDAHGHTHGRIPGARVSESIPPVWAHTHC